MKTRPDPSARHRILTLTMDDGRMLVEGDEFKVSGTPCSDGRYAFRYGWYGDVTCYGPLGRKSEDPTVRTFHQHNITTIHRKKIERTAST